MARYCIAFDTMKAFHGVKGTENLSELVSSNDGLTIQSSASKQMPIEDLV